MWLIIATGCAWLQDVDREAVEATAQKHRDAISALAPRGDSCDGLTELLAHRSPEGCRFRPATSLGEAGAVAARCTELLREPESSATINTIGLYGAWAATPVPMVSCATLVGVHGSPAQRRLLPPDEVAIHGARWKAWLALNESSPKAADLRAWLAVEDRCGDPTADPCIVALEQEGPAATRIDIDSVLGALRAAREVKP